MRHAAFLLVIAILLALGGAAGWYWWTEWRFVESTDDAYVLADTSVISPKIDGYLKDVRVGDNQPVGCRRHHVRHRRSRFRGQSGAGRGGGRDRPGDRRDLRQPPRVAAGDDRAGRGGGGFRRSRGRPRPSRPAPLCGPCIERLCKPTALRDRRGRCAQGRAALDKARAALVAERNQLAVLQSQKGEEEARLAQARAALVLARNDLDNTVIRAPVAGVVGNRAARVGQYVKPGSQLAALVPLPHVYVTANFKETQLTQMRPGQQADIVGGRLSGQTITGTIESFSPASGAQFSLLPPDNATGNFTKIVQRVPVRIVLPSDSPLLGCCVPACRSRSASIRAARRPECRRGGQARQRAQGARSDRQGVAMTLRRELPPVCLRRTRVTATKRGRKEPSRPRRRLRPPPPLPERNLSRLGRIGPACSRWSRGCFWRSWMCRSSPVR